MTKSITQDPPMPFTPDWCQGRPNNPNCSGSETPADINTYVAPIVFVIALVALILIIRNKINNKLDK